MIIFIINCGLLTGYYFLIRYYHRSWQQVPSFSYQRHGNPVFNEKISVVVPARNEETVIESCIQSLLQQSYPKKLLEIIIVDDHSTDATADIIRRFNDQGVKLLSLRENKADGRPVVAYKKRAIDMAIRSATGDLIVTTDADCTYHPDWLATIAAFRGLNKASFIVAPVKFKTGSSSLLKVFQALDFAILQAITAASVDKGVHSMCNGANLAYEKKLFEAVNGFEGIDQLPSGDDLLLMEKIKRQSPEAIAYLNAPQATVETLPADSWKAFFNQRIRWASKTGQYKDKRILWVLSLVFLLNLSLLVLLLGSIVQLHWLLLFMIAVFYKTIIEWDFVKDVLTWFDRQSLMGWFFFLQPLHIAYTVVAGLLGAFGSYEWKGRRITK